MLRAPRFLPFRRLAAVVALAFLAGCGSGGCGNCTVPPINPVPANIIVVPGVLPTPTPVPIVVPATPAPPVVIPPPPAPPAVPLTCAQNAITGQGVPLGTDATFAVLAGSTVTNAGPTIVTGDLGVSPGTAVTGFTGIAPGGPGTVVGGTIHAGDPAAATAQLDLTTAYNNAADHRHRDARRSAQSEQRVHFPDGIDADDGGKQLDHADQRRQRLQRLLSSRQLGDAQHGVRF
jgi:hypothetical protein